MNSKSNVGICLRLKISIYSFMLQSSKVCFKCIFLPKHWKHTHSPATWKNQGCETNYLLSVHLTDKLAGYRTLNNMRELWSHLEQAKWTARIFHFCTWLFGTWDMLQAWLHWSGYLQLLMAVYGAWGTQLIGQVNTHSATSHDINPQEHAAETLGSPCWV